jgi:hypothetical protein
MPATEKGKEISDRIKAALADSTDFDLHEQYISLESITSPASRSLFFERLIQSVEGYRLDNVTAVRVRRVLSGSDGDTQDQARIEDDDGDSDQLRTEAAHDDGDADSARYASYINEAALGGGGVLQSKEFSQLHERGFFISFIRWTVIDEIRGGERLELEAQFGQADTCSDFSYLVRGIFDWSDRKQEHNRTKRGPSRVESSRIGDLLKIAAERAYSSVISDHIAQDNANATFGNSCQPASEHNNEVRDKADTPDSIPFIDE